MLKKQEIFSHGTYLFRVPGEANSALGLALIYIKELFFLVSVDLMPLNFPFALKEG